MAVVAHRAGDDKPDNLRRLCRALAVAADAGARLVVAPEAAMHGFGRPDTPLAPVAEPLDGPFVTRLCEAAARHGLTVVAGMFETVPGDPGRAFNTVVAVGPSGLAGRYRKLHLFDALGWTESDRLATVPVSDDALLVFPAAELTVGVFTCYDLRFPEIARALADRGATLLAVPAAWVAGPGKIEQWRTLLAARAIENVSYLAAGAQPGPEYSGHSVLLDPSGEELSGVAQDEGVATAGLDAARVAELRERLPVLGNRRFRVVPA